ncbi:MAG TPA: hypothetical protein V6D29_05680 [Leptolyngbyaceae cyanobacterium]
MKQPSTLVEYPFIDKQEACKILNCSVSTLRRRMRTDLKEGIHWVQRSKGSTISYNKRLLEDYMAHLGDPDAQMGHRSLHRLPQAKPPQAEAQCLKCRQLYQTMHIACMVAI